VSPGPEEPGYYGPSLRNFTLTRPYQRGGFSPALLCALILISFICTLPIHAQTPAPNILTYGQSAVGTISAAAPEQVYAFTAQRGDLLTITLQRISGDLDPALILADSAGAILLVNDEDAANPGTLDAAIRDYQIRQTGTYLILATRFGRAAGTTRGGFTLALDLADAATLGFSAERPLFINLNTEYSGTLDAQTTARFYQFAAKQGDVITLEALRTRGNLEPILTLQSADRLTLVSATGTRGGLPARIAAYAIVRDGLYIVSVSQTAGNSAQPTGDYSLYVTARQGVSIGQGGTLLLTYGGVLTANLDARSLDQQYAFQGMAGDLVTILIQPTGGDLLPYLILYDANRRLIAQDDRTQPGAAKLVRVKLPATGSYIIVATRHGRAGGITKGSFTLTLSKEGT